MLAPTEVPAPTIADSQAVDLARNIFGKEGDVSRLESERDANFLIDCGAEKFVLKIANAAEDKSALETQHAVLAHIAAVDPQVAIPRIVPMRNGGEIAEFDVGNTSHFVRMVTWIPGMMAAESKKSMETLASLGKYLGRIDKALRGFVPEHSIPVLQWDLRQANALQEDVWFIKDMDRRSLVQNVLDKFEGQLAAKLKKLPASLIHNDANDWNVLLALGGVDVVGLIDFGDLVHSQRICELGVALPYFLFGQPDLLTSAQAMVSAYHEIYALEEAELEVLWDLIQVRLITTIVIGEKRAAANSNNDYHVVSLEPAWALLERMQGMNSDVAHFALRKACGLPPVPNAPRVTDWLESKGANREIGGIFDYDLRSVKKLVLDLGAEGADLGEEKDQVTTEAFTRHLFGRMLAAGAKAGIGLYAEDRVVYRGDQFTEHAAEGERRTIHTGIDVFDSSGPPVYAPLDGEIVCAVNNEEWLDYGPMIILRHQPDDLDCEFYTLYGHLALESLVGLFPGKKVSQGDRLGWLGDFPVNGDWPPHLHFQIMTTMLGLTGNFPGVAPKSQWDVWSSICIDPNLIMGMPKELFEQPFQDVDQLEERRRQKVGYNLSLSYENPLHIIRGEGCWLYSDDGRAYLDCVNNIAHVGHAHPMVTDAIACQSSLLNTNTRYLHEAILELSDRVTSTMPGDLSVCYFACTGTEANDLALRMAKAVTGREGVVVLDGAYHGNSNALIDLSPYKFSGKGGQGKKEHVEIATMPDPYRGAWRYEDPDHGMKYAAEVTNAISRLEGNGHGLAAFYAESIQSCGGQIVFPKGYLPQVYEIVRAAGGVTVADEVQVGFGRCGSHFWAFDAQGVVPDIVTLGKPMGNGHPISAVVTTPEIAAAFDNGMEYFNSFGRNPVSCAAALAVLDVIEDEGLQQKALQTGSYLLSALRELQHKYVSVGDVRGQGLFLGVELVVDKESREPDATTAKAIVNWLKEEKAILLSTDGPHDNVFKIKPPMTFGKSESDYLVAALDEALGLMSG